MKHRHNRTAAQLALGIALSLSVACGAPALAQDAADPVVATVNGKEIKRSDLVALKSGLSQNRAVRSG